MAENLEVQVRGDLGKRNTRRLRRSGNVPAILYGHGEANVCLAIPGEQVQKAVRHGGRLVNLTGAMTERAFIRDLQWDTFGLEVLHLDLTRVSEHELVEVHVAIELRGEAPGAKSGGVIDHVIHEVAIQCEVTSIPEKLFANINHLELGQAIKVSELELPATVKILAEADDIVVQCVEPVAEVEGEGAEGAPAEPEVIGRKKEDEEEAEE